MTNLFSELIQRQRTRRKKREVETEALAPLMAYASACGVKDIDIAPIGNMSTIMLQPRRFMCCLANGEPFTYSVGAGLIVGNDYNVRGLNEVIEVTRELQDYLPAPMEVLGAVCSDIVSIDGNDNWVEWADEYSLIDCATEADSQRRSFESVQQRRSELRAMCGRNTVRLINALNYLACEGTVEGIEIPEVI